MTTTTEKDSDAAAHDAAPSEQSHEQTQKNNRDQRAAQEERERRRREAVAAHPYVALVTHASGIHPTTSRLITVDVVTFNEAGEIGEDFHAVLDPNTDPGPKHQHGHTREEIAAGQRFSQVLKTLDRLIDGRTLVVHRASRTWGFVVSEARRAMNAAARANRSRSRGRGRSRRRQRVGHVPRPERIVDTLATARRQATPLTDTRIAAVAQRYGLPAPSPVASVERAQRPPQEVAREQTLLVRDLFFAVRDAGPVAQRSPKDLRADRFGLQRSHVRVDAVEVPRPRPNPGRYRPGHSLIRGMEVVVAPEVEIDPNTLIEACLREELVYSEKLTRETSLVVCNETTDLAGKAMHAARKDIPLMSDAAFLAAAERVKEQPGA